MVQFAVKMHPLRALTSATMDIDSINIRNFLGVMVASREDDAYSCLECRRSVKNVNVDNLVWTLHQMLNDISPTRHNVDEYK